MVRSMLRLAIVFLSASLMSCAPLKQPESAPEIAPATLSLVESEPIETDLDRPDIADASAVWREMFRSAKQSIDIAQFYASEAEPPWLSSSKLTPILEALVEAHKRGVKVRFLIDEKFVPQYMGTLEILEKSGFEVRRINCKPLFGEILHAKYFVIDGRASFIGSQNFDWRALDHIQEMGVRIHSAEIGSLLLEIFETDWALAGGAPTSTRIKKGTPYGIFSGIEAKGVELVASPKGWLPHEESWELPRIIGLLDGAKQSIDIQVLKYKTQDRAGNRFTDLDDALRRAAARGIKIRMLVSEWAVKDSSLKALQDLGPATEIRVIKVPEFSGGAIPFARVAHAKYLVVDNHVAWIGTSNWEGDYFTKCRNVGVILSDGSIPARLGKFFDENWTNNHTIALPPPMPASEAPSQ